MDHKNIIKKYCYRKDGNLNGRCSEFIWWKNKKIDDTYQQLLKFTHFLENATISQRIYHYLNNIDNIVTCSVSVCDNPVRWHDNINQYSKCCSKKCANKFSKKSRTQTCMEKYGVDNIFKDSEKIKNATKKVHGVDNYAKTEKFKEDIKNYWLNLSPDKKDKIKEKRKNTCQTKYGVNSLFESELIQEKIKSVMKKKYTKEYPLQVDEFLEKQKKTMMDRYGKLSYNQKHISDDFFSLMSDRTQIKKQMEVKSLKQLATEHGVSHSTICKYINKLDFDLNNYSSFETEVFNFIKSFYDNEIQRNVKILNKKEIDIYVPEKSLGIECHGVYWHSEISGKKTNKYHLDKHLEAKKNNIHLLQIFETEWYEKNKIIKNQILKYFVNHKIYARKCDIKLVSREKEFDFLENNHIKGYISSEICIGLYSDNQLIQIMSFGKSRYNKNYQWEILRLCSNANYIVVGGINRLFRFFLEKTNPDSIITYSDKRWFDGKSYLELGFQFANSSKPSYYYLVAGKLESRFKYQKHKLKNVLEIFDPKLTEWENMQINGFDRIWDCGNDVWIWEKQ